MPYFNFEEKKIFYKETGCGEPIVLLHGDTASGRMFEPLLPLYQEHFRVILIDFLGNGRSDRLKEFPADLWIWQAGQVIALIEHLNIRNVNLLGTSGGAWAAVNAALMRPDLIHKVIADSFDGRTLALDFAKNLLEERTYAKQDTFANQFYKWCQGDDWEVVVDLNTTALIQCAERKLPLFVKELQELKVPILFTGSKEDTMCRKNMQQEYRDMQELVSDGSIYMFPQGEHPAMVSNAERFADLVINFTGGFFIQRGV